MSIPRKHHYLPQFYLEGFKISPQKGKKPHIWQIEKGGNQKHYSPSIKDTGCIKDFHTLDHNDHEPDHKTIETQLSKIEGEQSELVHYITDNKNIDSSRIGELAEFISFMRHRVPTFALHVETSHRKIVLDSFKIMHQAGMFGTLPDELRKTFETNGIDNGLNITISNWKIVQQMLQTGLSSENINILSQFNYQIYYTENLDTFVTCDNPVALYHPNYDDIKPYGVGLGIKGVEVTFPLSSNILIAAGFHLKPGVYLVNHDQLYEFNRRTIIMSENYVFSSQVSDESIKQIANYQKVFAGFTFDNLYHGDGSVHISKFIPVQ